VNAREILKGDPQPMKALMKTAPGSGNLEVRDTPDPAPGPDDVIVEVSGCGICGSDLTLYHSADDPFAKIYQVDFPLVLGHELAGRIVDRGANVKALSEGDWVAVNPHLYCGTCASCVRGEEEICESRPVLGFDRPGGAAEYVAVRASNAYKLPERVGSTIGPLAEPLAVAVHAVERAGVKSAETVGIVGAGPIGALIAIACQEAGVARILLYGLERDKDRLALIATLGVETIVSTEGSFKSRVDELTGGRGLDVVFEAAGGAGADGALQGSLNLIRRGGRVSSLGLPDRPVMINPFDLVLSEKSIIGTRAYSPRSWERTVEVVDSRSKDLERLVTHRLPLEEWHQAFSLLGSQSGFKIFLEPKQTA
jgi:L-iditol 2-dehydrogenase